jgi:1-acyl-sn-glycerol-3-phosphate acyltransferase
VPIGVIRKARAALYAAYFFLMTVAFGLAGLVVRGFAPSLALPLARGWVAAVLAGLRPICAIHVEVTGLHLLPAEGPALLASQHQSEFDTLIWMRLLRGPSYILKQELTRIPLFGPMLLAAGMIPVDRSAGAAALRRLIEDTRSACAAGRQIVIFPEGTRVPPGQSVKLHPGIAAISSQLGLPVYPVATDSGRLWTRDRLGKHPGTIHIAIGPPIQAGMSRPGMLACIQAFWQRTEEAGFEPVDKSVGQPFPALSEQVARRC